MLKIIMFLFKVGILAAIVLVLGNVIEWRGKTVSDQIKTQWAQAQRTEIANQIRDWASKITQDSAQGVRKKQDAQESPEISSSERQKLRALIRELNNSRKE